MTLGNLSVHAKEYIGPYVTTNDFAFQEDMRQLDLSITLVVKRLLGPLKAQKFFDNGWGQLISAVYLLEANPKQLKISDIFRQLLNKKFSTVFVESLETENPFEHLNIRNFTRAIMLHPTHPKRPNKYLGWAPIKMEPSITFLNQLVASKDKPRVLSEDKPRVLSEDKPRVLLDKYTLYLKIHLSDESSIVDKLWGTNFAELLEGQGYIGFEPTINRGEVNLATPKIISDIQERFEMVYGKKAGLSKFCIFMQSALQKINEGLDRKEDPITFTQFAFAYSEDISHFEEVIVAQLKIPYFEETFGSIISEIEEELKFKLIISLKTPFHLVIATKPRKADPSCPAQMDRIFEGTGKKKDIFTPFWRKFVEPSSREEKTQEDREG